MRTVRSTSPGPRCQVDHIWRWSDGGPTEPANGQLLCAPHNQAREQPPPPSTRTRFPPRSPEEHEAFLELLRARIRDQVDHDPRMGIG